MDNDHISYSQLSLVNQCPYSYYLTKMAQVQLAENAFSQAGRLVHNLLYRWAKGEIDAVSLPSAFKEAYSAEVTELFPAFMEAQGYRKSLYVKCMRYLTTFEGFPQYEVIDAEKEFETEIGSARFVGIIDLILRNKETKAFVIMDHKSCSLGTFRKSQSEMYRQLYLYSRYIKDAYDVYPSGLAFNLFRENVIKQTAFDQERYLEALRWAEQTIDAMNEKELTDWFDMTPDDFFCTELCSCRNSCYYGKAENHGKGAGYEASTA